MTKITLFLNTGIFTFSILASQTMRQTLNPQHHSRGVCRCMFPTEASARPIPGFKPRQLCSCFAVVCHRLKETTNSALASERHWEQTSGRKRIINKFLAICIFSAALAGAANSAQQFTYHLKMVQIGSTTLKLFKVNRWSGLKAFCHSWRQQQRMWYVKSGKIQLEICW